VLSTSTIAHASGGRTRRPAFPAPSVERAGRCKHSSGRLRRENAKVCPHVVVPAEAGTHTPRPVVDRMLLDDFCATPCPVVMGPGVRRDDVERGRRFIFTSLRGAERRSNPLLPSCRGMDCFAALAMTVEIPELNLLTRRCKVRHRPNPEVDLWLARFPLAVLKTIRAFCAELNRPATACKPEVGSSWKMSNQNE